MHASGLVDTNYLYCDLSGLFVGTPQVGSLGDLDSATEF